MENPKENYRDKIIQQIRDEVMAELKVWLYNEWKAGRIQIKGQDTTPKKKNMDQRTRAEVDGEPVQSSQPH